MILNIRKVNSVSSGFEVLFYLATFNFDCGYSWPTLNIKLSCISLCSSRPGEFFGFGLGFFELV